MSAVLPPFFASLRRFAGQPWAEVKGGHRVLSPLELRCGVPESMCCGGGEQTAALLTPSFCFFPSPSPCGPCSPGTWGSRGCLLHASFFTGGVPG